MSGAEEADQPEIDNGNSVKVSVGEEYLSDMMVGMVANLRLDCLRMAIDAGRHDDMGETSPIVARAQAFYDFVSGETEDDEA